MREHPTASAFFLTGLVLVLSFYSCSPKCVVRGHVVDAETQQPIPGAAVAIRWYTESAENQSAKTETLDAVQSVTDDKGEFHIPEYLNKQYVLGVYRNGYICWSSQDIFSNDPSISPTAIYRKRDNHRIEPGMKIELEPLSKIHPKDLHAGFTVMVAGESTTSETGPFHQAIQSEYQLWRENLRKDFMKQVGAK